MGTMLIGVMYYCCIFSLLYVLFRVVYLGCYVLKSHACAKFCSVSVTLPDNVLVPVNVSCAPT